MQALRLRPLPFLARAGKAVKRKSRVAVLKGSGLQLGIPVKIVHPAFVQVVGREQPPVIVQVLNRRLERLLRREHARLLGKLAAFSKIAGRAGRHDIVPRGFAAMGAGNHVIEGQVVPRATILAFELVPKEHVEACEGGVAGGLDIGLEADDARQPHGKAG